MYYTIITVVMDDIGDVIEVTTLYNKATMLKYYAKVKPKSSKVFVFKIPNKFKVKEMHMYVQDYKPIIEMIASNGGKEVTIMEKEIKDVSGRIKKVYEEEGYKLSKTAQRRLSSAKQRRYGESGYYKKPKPKSKPKSTSKTRTRGYEK